MNVRETAEYLNLSPSTIYHLVIQKKMPFIKLGKSLRFRKPDLDAWIQTKSQIPRSRPTKNQPELFR